MQGRDPPQGTEGASLPETYLPSSGSNSQVKGPCNQKTSGESSDTEGVNLSGPRTEAHADCFACAFS